MNENMESILPESENTRINQDSDEYFDLLSGEPPSESVDQECGSVNDMDPLEEEVKLGLWDVNQSKCELFCKSKTDYVNVLVLSVSFTLLFAGFHSAQGFYTSLHDNGGVVLGLLYLFYSLGSLIAPVINRIFESKLTIIIGSHCYVLFVFLTGTNFNSWIGNTILCFSGIVCGCGSSVLWTAQGNIIVKSSTRETIGFCSGIFFSFFQCSIISGFFLSGILGILKVRSEMLFVILGWICVSGNLVMFLLKNRRYSVKENEGDSTTFCKSYVSSLFDTLNVLFDLKFMAYIVLFFFSGYTFGFYYGTFTKQAGTNLIPWLFVDFAICGVTGALVFGKMGDWFSRRLALTCVLLSHFISIVLLFLLGSNGERGDKPPPTFLWFVTIAACGISNTGLNVQIYSILGIYFKDNPPSAFAAFKVVQSMTVSFQFVTGSVFSFFQIKLILVFSVILSFIMFVIIEMVIPVDEYIVCKNHNVFVWLISMWCNRKIEGKYDSGESRMVVRKIRLVNDNKSLDDATL